MEPFEIFESWLADERQVSSARSPSACCLSTIGLDGYPNSRMVDMKELSGETFIITGALSSRKGLEIKATGKVSLNFWWPVTERQVRIQGDTHELTPAEIDYYFKTRSRDARLVAHICRQGYPVPNFTRLQNEFNKNPKAAITIWIPRLTGVALA